MMSSHDVRLDSLRQALARITRRGVPDAALTLGELGVDSSHLVQLMVACDHIYAAAVPFEVLDISIDTSVASLHRQILDALGAATPPGVMPPAG